MKNNRLFALLSITVIFVFITSLFSTVNVLADDSTPPPSTEEPVLPPTEEPIVEETPTEAPLFPPTEEPIVEETPTEAPITETESDPTPLPQVDPTETPEVDTPAEVLESAPEGVDVVVLDENGDAMSLVTEKAAEIIMSGDPVWCPENITPGNDSLSQCTPAYADLASLIDDLANGLTGSYAGNGTIYIASDYSASEGEIVIDHTVGNLSGLGDLVIQGGWDLNILSGTYNQLVGNSTLDDTWLFIDNWVGNVTVNNLFINNSDYDGLFIDTSGNVILDDVDVNNSNLTGAHILSGGDVVVTNSDFTENGVEGYYDYDIETNMYYEAQDGLSITAAGDVTLNNVYAVDNGGNGVIISADDVEITDSIFEHNGWGDGYGAYWQYDEYEDIYTFQYSDEISGANGLTITSSGDILLDGIDVYGNAGNGAELDALGDIFVANSTFGYDQESGNGNLGFFNISNYFYDNGTQVIAGFGLDYQAGSGLIADAEGDITLADVEAIGNANDGAQLYSENGNILITGSSFESNGGGGNFFDCFCGYELMLEYVDDFCEEAPYTGLAFDPCEDSYYIEVQGPDFDYEINFRADEDGFTNSYDIAQGGGTGLDAAANDGSITLAGVDVYDNGGDGAYLDGSSGVEVTNSEFGYNGGLGYLGVGECSGAGMQNCVYTEGEAVDMAYGAHLGFGYGDGLHVDSDGNITLRDVEALYNGNNGALTHSDASVFIEGGEFSHNASYPIYIGGEGGLFGYYLYDQFGLEESLEIPASEFYLNASTFDGMEDGEGGLAFYAGFASGDGLEADANSNITLVNVLAEENGGNGANLYADNIVNISESDFNDNGFGTNGELAFGLASMDGSNTEFFMAEMSNGNGLFVDTEGGIVLTDVTANDNALYGAELNNNSNVLIEDSEFSRNGQYGGFGSYQNHFMTGYYDEVLGQFVIVDQEDIDEEWYGSGLYIESEGNVTLIDVTANNNYLDGAEVYVNGGRVIVSCGQYDENGEYGIYVEDASALELNGPEILDNGNSPDEYFFGGTIILSDDCTITEEEEEEEEEEEQEEHQQEEEEESKPSRPIVIIPVTGDLDCTAFNGTLLLLPNGDNALFPCPIQDEGKIEVVLSDDLPGNLPDGKNFLSAFTTFLFKDGKAQDISEELITISFIIPEGADKEALSILFWNDTEWIDLGGEVSDDGLYFQVPTKLIGTFVLVSK